MPASLPVIDFSPFRDATSAPARKLATARAIDRACRDVGFFYLSHHGVPAPLVDAMRGAARAFFEANTAAEKEALAIRTGDGARGFSRVGGAATGTHEALDLFRPVAGQSPPYTIGMGENQWPAKPRDFRDIAEAYVSEMLSLATHVLRAIAMGLGVAEEVFTSKTDEAFWNLRIVSYRGHESAHVAGMGEHSDFGILTFLVSSAAKGSFQVRSKTGEWMPADPREGCFLVNIGDMLAEWTGGQYQSTRHRVVHRDGAPRYSVPFFFDPNFLARISPVVAAGGADGPRDERREIRYRDRFIDAMK